MRRIMVTGGSGFIGANFIRYWIARHPEDRIANLDKLTYAGNVENLRGIDSHPSYRFIQGDICDADLLASLFRAEKISTVVHFAAQSHVDRSILEPDEFIRTNVHGTFTLLEAARNYWLPGSSPDHASGCPADESFLFLHVSTDEVYGSLDPKEAPFKETRGYAPNSPYSASKAASDHLVRAYYHTYGLPSIVTNCSNNYGPYQFPEKLVPLSICRAVRGETIPIYGDGRNIRDWLYVHDHCLALEAVLERGIAGETYNIGGGEERENIDLVMMICDLLDERLGSLAFPRRSLIRLVQDRPGHDRRYAMDISKITGQLGWRPSETLSTGMGKTVDWYLNHQGWVKRVTSGEYRRYLAAQYGSRLGTT